MEANGSMYDGQWFQEEDGQWYVVTDDAANSFEEWQARMAEE